MKLLFTLLLFILISFASRSQNFILNFEDTTVINQVFYTDTFLDPQHIWQIGIPNKPLFDSAYSQPNAIVTLLDSALPPNVNASFIIGIPDSIYQLYQVKYGQSVARTRERLRAGLAGKQFASWLDLKPQSPVITIRRIAFNLQDEPIEWRVSTLNTAQHEYFNELVV